MILLLVFGAVVAGLMPMLMGLLSIIVGLGIAALLAREFSLSVFIVNMMTGMGLALGIDYSLFIDLSLPGGTRPRPRQGGGDPDDGSHR